MTAFLAFIRRDALVATSYRTAMILSILSLITIVVPVYFISEAVHPIAESAIRGEAQEYFGFAIVGLATFQFVMAALNAIPTNVASGIRTGTFEAMLATPTRLWQLLMGMAGYQFLWTFVRSLVLLAGAAVLGAHIGFSQLLVVAPLWILIALAYVPFGFLGSAALLVFRTTGPLLNGVLMVSMLLGGVYYPTHVIPAWLQHVSNAVPLTYGLRAVRRTLLTDAPLSAIVPDVLMLVGGTAALFIGSLVILHWTVQYARRSGTLAHY